MMSKHFTNVLRSGPNFHDIEGACHLVLEKFMRKCPNFVPNTTAKEWLEILTMGSNRIRFETCWHKHDGAHLWDAR